MKIRIEIEIEDANVYANRECWDGVMKAANIAAVNLVGGLNHTFELDAILLEVEEYYGKRSSDLS